MSISARAEIITRRTYCRPLNDEGTEFETWEQVIERVIRHQKWLWERAMTQAVLPGMPLHDITEDMSEWVSLRDEQEYELEELFELMYHRKALPSGRTLWLGGTDISKTREASQFNCSHLNIETIYDMVDAFWLLLQGCGVGATPKVGTLNGFRKPINNIDIIRSTKRPGDPKGREWNEESFIDGVWHLSIGDSAEAWAKAVGKILANKVKAHTLILDFSEIRAEGQRLKGYGWISSGDGPFSNALPNIAEIMNRRSGSLLKKLDIVEVMNLLGTVLSSRRSAEIMLVEHGSAEWYEFSKFKERCYEDGFKHRQQSNNSLVFYNKPSKDELAGVFDMMIAAGGSEPGFYNGRTALQRAPWFAGTNPCGEILLANKSFCNLSEIDVGKFIGDSAGLHRAATLISRANYRQTVVDLRDGILQEAWHKNNEFLRLCGVGVTGIAKRDDMTEYDWKNLRYSAVTAARTMSGELKMEYPKNVTTVNNFCNHTKKCA
jgi:ribonucleoside-triphosphate reductase